MKVLFVAGRRAKGRFYQATNRLRLMEHLPCEVTVCDARRLEPKWVEGIDVVLLDYMSNRMLFPEGYEDIFEEFQGLIGAFYGDVWTENHLPPQDIGIDMHLFSFWESLKSRYPLLKPRYFVPACIDIHDARVPRDIDILVWGAVTTPYPFRCFCTSRLAEHVADRDVKLFPGVNKIVLNRKEYTFVYLDLSSAREQGYFGPKLFSLLSKAKICCTGPVQPSIGDIVVGKYFENAASGVVTVSSKFSDMEALGFKHGDNVWITNRKQFVSDIVYLLKNNSVREQVSENAKQLIRDRHTPEIRGREFYTLLCNRVNE